MNEKIDWYPRSQDGERSLYGNIDAKIDGYKIKYPFLTTDYLTSIHSMCQTFMEGFDTMIENRATAKKMNNWFEDIVSSKQTLDEVPPAPVFQAFSMPAGAKLGLEEQCRQFARLMKNQPNYDTADGIDLMIERERSADSNVNEAVPELRITKNASDNSLDFEWQKAGFDMLELQWRKAGAAMWQQADKSTEKVIRFAPPIATPGTPEKFEFRAVYLIKNQRVGNWSPIYTETVG